MRIFSKKTIQLSSICADCAATSTSGAPHSGDWVPKLAGSDDGGAKLN